MAKKKVVKSKKTIGLTELVIVLDQSGSMSSIRLDTIGGFNTLLSEQKKLGKDIKVSLVLFNALDELVHDGVAISDIPDFSEDTYIPSGSTALLDAVGKTIDTINARIESTPKKKQPKKVIMAIITDGQENSSHKFSKADIKEKIEAQKGKGWEFVFLGANQDAFAEGGGLGVARASSCTFAADSKGIKSAYLALSAHTQSYRTGGAGVDVSAVYNDAQQKKS